MEKAKEKSTVSRGGLTTIPKRIREVLDIRGGDLLVWEARGYEAIVRRVRL